MLAFQDMKWVIGYEIMKLFIHVQTGFCASTLARVVMRLVLPGEDVALCRLIQPHIEQLIYASHTLKPTLY